MRLTLADVLTLAGDSDELLDAIAEVMAPQPPSAAHVVEYLQIPTGSVFNLAPTRAIEYFKAKGLRPTFSYADMLDEAHDEAFTIAKMMDVDLLGQVRASLSDAMANGIPFRQWSDEIIPMLQKSGWWGTKELIDPVTGQPVLARLGTPGRLKTIFRTNMQSSYSAGQWEQIDATKQVAPYLLYDAVDDYRTREEHAAWDGTVLKVDDPWWNDHYPPNGYNCRCSVIQLSEDEVKALNLQPDPEGGPDYGTVDWKNPRTGLLEAIPWGLDPGFSHHSGKHYLKTLKKRLNEKIAAMPPAAAAQASEGVAVSGAAAEVAKETAKLTLAEQVAAAQKELAKAAGKAHLKHAIERAHAQAAAVAKAAEEAKKAIAAAKAAEAEAAAKAKLDAIVKAGGANTYEKAALKKLLNDQAWSALPASERLAQFEQLASTLKAKQLVDTKLAKYKKAVLEGKTPPPNVAKVLDELDEATKTAFLKKIDDELAAKKAAEEAAQTAALQKEWDDAKAAVLADPEIAYAVTDASALQHVLDLLESAPLAERIQALKGYADILRSNAQKAVLKQIDDLETEIGGFPFAEIPGEQFGPLGKKLNAIYEAVADAKKDWAGLSFTQKKTLAENYRTKWNELKAQIAAEKADNLAQVELNKELGIVQNELDDLLGAGITDAQWIKDTADQAISKYWAGWSIDKKSTFLEAFKTQVAGVKADLAKTPRPPPTPPTASKQWLNVDKAAMDLFDEFAAGGYSTHSNQFLGIVQSEKWTKGKITLKAKKEIIENWKGTLTLLKQGGPPPGVAAPAVPSAAPPAGVNAILATKPPVASRLTQIGPQKGSNPGGLFQDTQTGEKFYVKFFDADDRAYNELLAGKLYELLGADTPELAVFKWTDGRTAVSSKWVDGLQSKISPASLAKAEGAKEFFAADAWLANWDVVGAEFDNLVLRGTRAFRVDVGGSLRYRAMGTEKGAAFGDVVEEIDTLRSGRRNSQAVSVFRSISDDDLLASVRRVLKPTDEQIAEIVEAFGPRDKATRDALLKTLLARREYLRKRFPNAAPQPTRTTVTQAAPRSGPIRMTAEDARAIQAARMNGITVKTDGLDVEDHHVLVATYTGKRGPTTRVSLKLTPEARKRVASMLRPQVKGSAAASDLEIVVDLSNVPSNFRQWVIGVNSRTGKGAVLEAKDLERAHATKAEIAAARQKLTDLAGRITAPAEAERQRLFGLLDKWEAELDQFLGRAKAGELYPQPIGKQDFDAIPSRPFFEKVQQAAATTPKNWKWQADPRASDPFVPMQYSKGNYTASGKAPPYNAEWGDPVWSATGPNGEKILFAAEDDIQRAMQGTVWIDVPGADAAAAQRAFDALEEVFKVKAVAPTEFEVGEQYLNAFARLRLYSSNTESAYRQYKALDAIADPDRRMREKLDFLELSTGVDIRKSDGWRDRFGIDPTFGNGRAYQVRPDTDGPDWERFERDHLVYINPNGLDVNAGNGVGDKLVRYLDSGGKMLSQAERLRRGIVSGGASTQADRASGGAAYVFTRIFGWSNSNTSYFQTGIYLKSRLMRRLDAITYRGDNYGATTDHHLLNARQRLPDDFARASANSTGNETIFKESVSLFDSVEFVVVKDSEVRGTIEAIRQAGYTLWPDGRKLEDIVIGLTDFNRRKASRRK